MVPAWQKLLSQPVASLNMIDGAYLLAVAHTPQLKRSDIDQSIKRIAQLVWYNMGIGKYNYLNLRFAVIMLTRKSTFVL
jgi:hypothetical protein